MNLRRYLVLVPSLLSVLGLLNGCNSGDFDTSDEDLTGLQATPPYPTTVFDQAKICGNVLKARAGFRSVDLEEGVLRWNCGDVNGVTYPDLGQEYCEFHAVLNGRIVDRETIPSTSADDVECLFTSVFADVSPEPNGFAEDLAAQIAPQLKNAEALDPSASIMRVSFNSRDAARVLIDDCSGLATDPQLDAERQAACAVAWTTAPPEKKAELEAACRGVDLADEAAFARARELGVTPRLDNEEERDIAACSLLMRAPNGGVGWRNSDPSICARSVRAARCGYDFADIPASVEGFELKGWAHRDSLPSQCRYLEIDKGEGRAPYSHLVACTADRADVELYNRSRKPLQMMCRDKFGINLAVQAPLRALTVAVEGAESTETEAFCSAFVGAPRSGDEDKGANE